MAHTCDLYDTIITSPKSNPDTRSAHRAVYVTHDLRLYTGRGTVRCSQLS